MQGIREIAYKFLLQNHINEPPHEIAELENIAMTNGWDIYPYSRAAKILEALHLTEYCKQYKGFTFIEREVVIIFYDDKNSYKDKLFVICHEMGHLILQHTFSGTVTISCDPNDVQELEANTFARELLLPLPALHRIRNIGIRGVVERNIASESIAKEQFSALPERNIYKSSNAQAVSRNWQDYIARATGAKRRRRIFLTVLCSIISVAVIATGGVAGVLYYHNDSSPIIFTTTSPPSTSATTTATGAAETTAVAITTTQATTAKPTPAPTLPPTTTRYIPPAPTTVPRPKPPTEWITPVYCTESGKKYHATPNCSALKGAKTPVYQYDYMEAVINGGRTPCSICYDLLS